MKPILSIVLFSLFCSCGRDGFTLGELASVDRIARQLEEIGDTRNYDYFIYVDAENSTLAFRRKMSGMTDSVSYQGTLQGDLANKPVNKSAIKELLSEMEHSHFELIVFRSGQYVLVKKEEEQVLRLLTTDSAASLSIENKAQSVNQLLQNAASKTPPFITHLQGQSYRFCSGPGQ